MRPSRLVSSSLGLGLLPWVSLALPAFPLPLAASSSSSRNITKELFYDLEELARVVDISYCVGMTGIQKPFSCASRCSEFKGFELITTWNTGPLLSDSCGYIAVSHPPSPRRILVAFRGTYSIANTLVDLSTVPQEYVPYPPDGGEEKAKILGDEEKCPNCTVHMGFLQSWTNTRHLVLPEVEKLVEQYPDYRLTLVGHSLGGAVAGLASLEFHRKGWNPLVTTFGEPRVGNQALMEYFDARFDNKGDEEKSTYRRVTHVDDPVPLLPLEEWGYKMHGGEIFISKPELQPDVCDLVHCDGDEDPKCIAGTDKPETKEIRPEWWGFDGGMWTVPKRFRMWQIFFAHRDYFWRLGLCVPGGDPKDWYRKYPHWEDDDKIEL